MTEQNSGQNPQGQGRRRSMAADALRRVLWDEHGNPRIYELCRPGDRPYAYMPRLSTLATSGVSSNFAEFSRRADQIEANPDQNSAEEARPQESWALPNPGAQVRARQAEMEESMWAMVTRESQIRDQLLATVSRMAQLEIANRRIARMEEASYQVRRQGDRFDEIRVQLSEERVTFPPEVLEWAANLRGDVSVPVGIPERYLDLAPQIDWDSANVAEAVDGIRRAALSLGASIRDVNASLEAIALSFGGAMPSPPGSRGPWRNLPAGHTCCGCQNYHGEGYGRERLYCGFHPRGPEEDRKSCKDWEAAI